MPELKPLIIIGPGGEYNKEKYEHDYEPCWLTQLACWLMKREIEETEGADE